MIKQKKYFILLVLLDVWQYSHKNGTSGTFRLILFNINKFYQKSKSTKSTIS